MKDMFKEFWDSVPLTFKLMWAVGFVLSVTLFVAFITLIYKLVQHL